MMIRSFDDLHPLLRRQYARNKEQLESGTAPPIADMFSDTDIVFAVWPDAGILNYIMIKGRGRPPGSLRRGRADIREGQHTSRERPRRSAADRHRRTAAARSGHHAD